MNDEFNEFLISSTIERELDEKNVCELKFRCLCSALKVLKSRSLSCVLHFITVKVVFKWIQLFFKDSSMS